MIAIENNQYSLKKPLRQYFAFPSDVISHFLINPKSGNGLEKLYQTCKYFFSKRKILVINSSGHKRGNPLYYHAHQKNGSSIDITKIHKNQALLWFTGDLFISGRLPAIFKTIYRCSINSIYMFDVILSYNEFELIVSENTVQFFHICDASIYFDENLPATLDVILKNLPNVEKFRYKDRNETYSAKTLQKMSQTVLGIKLKYCFFYILDISNDFNTVLLCKFIEQHPSCVHKINIENARSSEMKQNIETALKDISKNDKTKEFNVTVNPMTWFTS